ncbi:MAG: restriction endonuclease subunit S [Oscillospiraceae bacterium]|nr:restriction endonuclease subunit S [Oscillospiraceae bacterium]
MKLGNIATVRSGLVLSRKQAREPSDIRYPLLNLRSINPGGYIEADLLDVFDAAEYLSPEYLSQIGDVIVRLTAPYTAILIDKVTAGMVISSNFVIIRADRRELLPEYLFWLINTPKVKRSIYENTSSNMLGAIKAKYFSDFEVPFLPIAKQQQIAAMNELALKETKLLRQLADEKERYYSLLIDRTYKEMKRGN